MDGNLFVELEICSVKIEPGATITVWSSDSGRTHEPPYNIVMKGQKWFVADS